MGCTASSKFLPNIETNKSNNNESNKSNNESPLVLSNKDNQNEFISTIHNSISNEFKERSKYPFDDILREPNKCPFGHGSVYVDPYPGYVHGRSPTICPAKCMPRKEISSPEYSVDLLIREALEYQCLYHTENHLTEEARVKRSIEIEEEIRLTGTYKLSSDELSYGVKVSWRNAPKCANRAHWKELVCHDSRDVATNEEAFLSILNLIEESINSSATVTKMLVLPQFKPSEKQGPRIWNDMIFRFAGYKNIDGNILGDPANVDFTDFLINKFNWQPPSFRTKYDVLPLLLQMKEDEDPQLFPIPSSYIPTVPIRLPVKSSMDLLDLRWFGLPIVSGMELTIGGIRFTACPFVGWFADTEVVRNLSDKTRYNILPDIAQALDIDTSTSNEVWIEEAIFNLNKAVVYSFRKYGLSIISHHTMLNEFIDWYNNELKIRGYCPGNWKWIVPPISASTCDAYLALNKMTEYTLKPAILPPKPFGWRHFKIPTKSIDLLNKISLKRQVSRKLINKTCSSKKTSLSNKISKNYNDAKTIRITVAFASVSGTTKDGAKQIEKIFGDICKVVVFDLSKWEQKRDISLFKDSAFTIFATSTYGSGQPPPSATSFFRWLQLEENKQSLSGIIFSVIGYGSTSYPRFCSAAINLTELLLKVPDAKEITPLCKIDSCKDIQESFLHWFQTLIHSIKDSSYEFRKEISSYFYELTMGIEVEEELCPLNVATLSHSAKTLKTLMKNNSHTGTITQVRNLIVNEKESRCISNISFRLDPNDGYCLYKPGDNIVIYPVYSDIDVESAADIFRLSDKLDLVFVFEDPLDELEVRPKEETYSLRRSVGGTISGGKGSSKNDHHPFPTPTSIRIALAHFLAYELMPTIKVIKYLLNFAEGGDYEMLQDLIFDEGSDKLTNQFDSYLSLFKTCQSLRKNVPIKVLFQIIPPQFPRYYSGSSSLSFQPNHLDLTVALKVKSKDSSRKFGVCSNYLVTLKPETIVEFDVVSVPSFHLPINQNSPIICISTGSGFAPFRGFLQERFHDKTQHHIDSEFILIHGCRNEAEILYRDEIDEAVASGVLTSVHYALSRSRNCPKTYVNDLLKTDSLQKKIKDLFNQDKKCYLYVCGDAKMSCEVANTLIEILGEKPFELIRAEGRFKEEVFGLI